MPFVHFLVHFCILFSWIRLLLAPLEVGDVGKVVTWQVEITKDQNLNRIKNDTKCIEVHRHHKIFAVFSNIVHL